jgi:hypothetical protein
MKATQLFVITLLCFFCNKSIAQNVGIGNATPTMKLDVKATDSAALLLTNSSTVGTEIKTSLFFKTGSYFSGGIATVGYAATHRMGLFTYGASTPSGLYERLSITDPGYVGIGITNPTQAKLVVNGNSGRLTNAVFGGDGTGISLQKNWPTIGYNSYRDDYNNQRYLGTGWAYGTSVDQVNGVYFWNKMGYGAADGPVGSSELYVMGLSQDGNLGIGTQPSSYYKLAVNGFVRSKEVVVETGWADYVFAKDYKLPSLIEVEKYIKANNHLPEIPSAKEIQENGLKVGEVQTKMMQKIEELTLYIIEQNKRIEALEKMVNTK